MLLCYKNIAPRTILALICYRFIFTQKLRRSVHKKTAQNAVLYGLADVYPLSCLYRTIHRAHPNMTIPKNNKVLYRIPLETKNPLDRPRNK